MEIKILLKKYCNIDLNKKIVFLSKIEFNCSVSYTKFELRDTSSQNLFICFFFLRGLRLSLRFYKQIQMTIHYYSFYKQTTLLCAHSENFRLLKYLHPPCRVQKLSYSLD